MGTSTPFGGPKNGNPLIPTWLESPAPPAAAADPAIPRPTADHRPKGTVSRRRNPKGSRRNRTSSMSARPVG